MKTHLFFLALCFFLVTPVLADQEPAASAAELEVQAASEHVTIQDGTVCLSPTATEYLFSLLGHSEQGSSFLPASAECRAGCYIALRSCIASCRNGSTTDQACLNVCFDEKDDCDSDCNGSGPGTCFPGTPQWPECITNA